MESTPDIRTLFNDQAGSAAKGLAARPTAAKDTPATPVSPTVLEVDRWGARRGADLAAEWDILSKPEDGAEAPAPYVPETAADAHQALFHPTPRPAPLPKERERAAWFTQLMQTDEYRRLHKQTCLDPGLSSLAAKGLVDQWRVYAAEHAEPGENDPAPGSDGEPFGNTLARLRSTSNALKEAADTVQTAKDTAYGLGFGTESAPLDEKQLATYFQRVRDDDFLRQLMRMAGRMRTLCQTLQRTKTQHGRDDTVGVELAGDVSRLVPSELAQLACGIPELELIALDRVARRQAMCRRYRAVERLSQGPIVLVVDESGSMGGEPIITAKAMALALVWLAKQQRRWIALVGFSDTGSYNRVAFAPGKVDQDTLIKWLVHFYGGGTDLDGPLETLPKDWDALVSQGLTRGRTDVILITDAQVHTTDEARAAYERWAKAEQVRTYGVVLGQEEGGVLEEICSRCWCLPSLDIDSAAVEAVLSI